MSIKFLSLLLAVALFVGAIDAHFRRRCKEDCGCDDYDPVKEALKKICKIKAVSGKIGTVEL